MTPECRKAQLEDFPALEQMLELYQYELSDIWPQPLSAQGRYGYDLAPHKESARLGLPRAARVSKCTRAS
ncbi:MAG: hypothetical protein HZC37_22050 [Burkholderiales bacterium]|nr:hypothetical protein [Burkholderiales bacterium]